MREIKFRAWEFEHERTKGIGWASSPMIWKIDYDPEIVGGETMCEGDIVNLNRALANGGDADYKNEKPSIYMQFTGLKDKNGVEIYEGDIVKCSSGCPHKITWMDEVPCDAIFGGMPGFYLVGLRGGYAWMGTEEVIGNIYENPELLEKA